MSAVARSADCLEDQIKAIQLRERVVELGVSHVYSREFERPLLRRLKRVASLRY